MAEPRWMRCAYCGVQQPWNRQFFPDPITATCAACLREHTRPAPTFWQRIKARLSGSKEDDRG